MIYPKIASFKTQNELVKYLNELDIHIPIDDERLPSSNSPLAQSIKVYGGTIGNRLCVLPMEGWDGTVDGHPTNLTYRRWRRFGLSGAKLIWGGEAVAVRADGKANPNQLIISPETLTDLALLRLELVNTHKSAHGKVDDLYVGLQLTHSGRYARPNGKSQPEPMLTYNHPRLNQRVGLPQFSDKVISDQAIDLLIEDYIKAAILAQKAGFDFVDIKHCHGYLGHELLSAVDRPGKYGGSLENRTRFLCNIVMGVQSACSGLGIGVRLSAFDFGPFSIGSDGVGQPDWDIEKAYPYAFGGDGTGMGITLDEPIALINRLSSLGVNLICITAGSPYYNPHIQRPAYFPPSDGYLPPEDPLIGFSRQLTTCAKIKQKCPQVILVGSAYSCLQEWLPYVAQAVVRQNWVDLVGLGRMMLSYPEMPSDILAGRPLQRKRICRTFSDCTTAPRKGLVSGCYPLDELYKNSPEALQLTESKKISS